MKEKPKEKQLHGAPNLDPNFVFQSYSDEMDHVHGVAIPLVTKGKDFVLEDEVALGSYRRDYQWAFTGTLAMYDSPKMLAELKKLLKNLINENAKEAKENVLYEIELVFKKIREIKGNKGSDQAALKSVPKMFDQYVKNNKDATPKELVEKCIVLVKACAKDALLATTERDKVASVDILKDEKRITLTPGAHIADYFPKRYNRFGALFEVYSNQQYFQNIRQGILSCESPFSPTQFGPKAASRVQLIIPQSGDEKCAYYQSKWYIGSVVPTGVETYGRRLHAGVVSTLLRISKGDDNNQKTFDDLNTFNVDLVFTERMITDPHDLALFEHQLLSGRFNSIVMGEKVELKNELAAIARLKEKFPDRREYIETENKLSEYLKHLAELANALPSENSEPNTPFFCDLLPIWQAETLLLLAYYDTAFAKRLFGSYDEASLNHLDFLIAILKHPNLSVFIDKIEERHVGLRSNLAYLKETTDAFKNKQWQVIANGLHDKKHANARRGFILAMLRTIDVAVDAEAALTNVMLRESLDDPTLQHLVLVCGAKNTLLDYIERPSWRQRLKDNIHRKSTMPPKKKAFEIQERVEHLKANPKLWDSIFSKKNKPAYREQFSPDHLFDLLMDDACHAEVIFCDESLREKLWILPAEKRLALMKKNHVGPDDETEAYKKLLPNVFDMVSDNELQDYFKSYFDTLFGRYTQGLKKGELKYPDRLSDELAKVLDSDHRYQKKNVAHLLLRKILASQEGGVKQIFKQFVADNIKKVDFTSFLFDYLDNSIRHRIIAFILDDAGFIANICKNKATFEFHKIFTYCLDFFKAGTHPSMGLNQKQLANVFKLITEETLLEYFCKNEGMANQLAELMIQDNKFFHLFDHFRGGKENPHRIIQVFIRNLDDKHRRILQYTLSRMHLTYQESDVAKNNANVADQIKELKSVVNNLKKVSLKALKERESIKSELELLDKKRLQVWGAIERERLNAGKASKKLIEQHNKQYEELNADIDVLKMKIADKGKEINAVKLDPVAQPNHNHQEMPTVDRPLILEFLAAIKNFFAELFAKWFSEELGKGQEEGFDFIEVNEQHSVDSIFVEISESLRYLYRPNMTAEEAIERFKHTFSLLDEAKLVKLEKLSVKDTMPTEISVECKQALRLAKARSKEKRANYSQEIADLIASKNYRDELCMHFMTSAKLKTKFFGANVLSSSVLKIIEALKKSEKADVNDQLPKFVEIVISHAINNKEILSLVNRNSALLEEILKTDDIDDQMLLELIILLKKDSTIKSDVWYTFLDKHFKTNLGFIFDPLHFMIFKNHIKGFEAWVFSKYAAGDLVSYNDGKGKEEEGEANDINVDIKPEIVKIISACTFNPQDYVKALYGKSFLYEHTLEDTAVKRHIIGHLSETELVDLICHEHTKLKAGNRRLYQVLVNDPVFGSIIQFASPADLLKLAELEGSDNSHPFAVGIAEYFVKNVDVRRTVVSFDDDNKLLQLLLDNATNQNFVKMVLLSTDVMQLLLENDGVAMTKRFVDHATTNQFVDLALHEVLGSKILAKEIVNVDKIKEVLEGDTSQTKVRRILPALLQIGSKDMDDFVYSFMFDVNEIKFTSHFLELLENATAKELYDIFTACREYKVNNILQRFIGAMYLGANTQLIDNLLMHCTEKQMFEVLVHEHENHEFVCERIIALCFENNADENPKLVERIRKVFGREVINEVSASQHIVKFLTNVRQTVTARVSTLFNEAQLDDALKTLEEKNIDRGEAMSWKYFKEYGKLMNDDADALGALKEPKNHDRAIELLNSVSMNNLIDDNDSNKVFIGSLKELRMHYVANDLDYFLQYIKSFKIKAAHNGIGYKFEYVDTPAKDLSDLDKRLIGEARSKMGQENFWKAVLVDSKTEYKELWDHLIDYKNRAERRKPVLDLMIEIFSVHRNDFYLYFGNERYDVIKAEDKQLELVYKNGKGALTPSDSKRILRVVKKRDELRNQGCENIKTVTILHEQMHNSKDSKAEIEDKVEGKHDLVKNTNVKRKLFIEEGKKGEKVDDNNNNKSLEKNKGGVSPIRVLNEN